MVIDAGKLIEVIQEGIPICPRPYAEIAKKLACAEQDIIRGIADLGNKNLLRRFGVIVKHRRLGYDANAMVVWNIADELAEELGKKLAAEPAVTLCYERPRRLPHWPYNIFTMLHGREREAVINEINEIRQRLGIDSDYDVLFSTRCFKQQGARYF